MSLCNLLFFLQFTFQNSQAPQCAFGNAIYLLFLKCKSTNKMGNTIICYEFLRFAFTPPPFIDKNTAKIIRSIYKLNTNSRNVRCLQRMPLSNSWILMTKV